MHVIRVKVAAVKLLRVAILTVGTGIEARLQNHQQMLLPVREIKTILIYLQEIHAVRIMKLIVAQTVPHETHIWLQIQTKAIIKLLFAEAREPELQIPATFTEWTKGTKNTHPIIIIKGVKSLGRTTTGQSI